MTAREVLLAWAKSPGFAAIHNGQATDEQIVDDLLAWLEKHEAVLFMKKVLQADIEARMAARRVKDWESGEYTPFAAIIRQVIDNHGN